MSALPQPYHSFPPYSHLSRYVALLQFCITQTDHNTVSRFNPQLMLKQEQQMSRRQDLHLRRINALNKSHERSS
jgi:hypothetical protein